MGIYEQRGYVAYKCQSINDISYRLVVIVLVVAVLVLLVVVVVVVILLY